MIGLPFQTEEHLAKDLMFMQDFDIDMCGMGPYIEHKETPLWIYKNVIPPKEKRFELTLKMVALLRIMMKDINIAATTAMQTIFPDGRIKAVKAGANVIMPNITPGKYRDDYFLYEDKPSTFETPEDHLPYLERKLKTIGHNIGYGLLGTAPHYYIRTNTK
jgi:biotin synthase